MTTIESILRTNGPMISGELAKKLELAESIPYNTASQHVTRNKKIFKIKGFYRSNQSLCYLKIHENEEILYDSFIKSLYDFGRKYWFCINALNLHGGTLRKDFLECYTNYPVLPLKKHVPFNKVMQKFVQNGVLVYNNSYYSIAPRFLISRQSPIANKTIEQIKEDTLSSFHMFAKNIGLISYKTGETFAEYGKFRWAFKGVSTITGLMQNEKTGFLLADILMATSIYENDVKFFVEKIKHIQSFNGAPKLIPFLLVDDLDNKALRYLKSNGIIVGFIGELFGQKYAETLRELITILNNAGASLKSNPNKYLELIKQLKKYNEGLVNNIRGTLFEYMVGHIHSINSQMLEIGREIIEFNSRHEMDIYAIYSDKVVIAECKATKSKIKSEVIDSGLMLKYLPLKHM
jgi:hypothetical protein